MAQSVFFLIQQKTIVPSVVSPMLDEASLYQSVKALSSQSDFSLCKVDKNLPVQHLLAGTLRIGDLRPLRADRFCTYSSHLETQRFGGSPELCPLPSPKKEKPTEHEQEIAQKRQHVQL